MSAEEPRTEEPPPQPAPQPAAPAAAPPRVSHASRNRLVIIVAAMVIALALGGYWLARSGLLSGGQPQESYTVEAYTPPQQLVSARERVLAHARPDASSPTVVMFGAGAALDVNGRVSRGIGEEWYRIAWNGQTAFIRRQDATPGEGAPPGVAERPKPEEREEAKPADEADEETDVAAFPEAPSTDVGLSEVQWVRRPNERDVARFYPDRALDRGQSGRVVLDCVADGRGDLDCSVAEESPPGWGFGDAALRIAGRARVEATTSDGASVAGRHVRLPLSFRAE